MFPATSPLELSYIPFSIARIMWKSELFVFFFLSKSEAQFFQLRIPHFFLLHISFAEYPRSGSNICHNYLPASSSSEEGIDIDTIAENQNTWSVKLVEGNQNNSAMLTTSSAGTHSKRWQSPGISWNNKLPKASRQHRQEIHAEHKITYVITLLGS